MNYKKYITLLQILCLLSYGSSLLQAQHVRGKAKGRKPSVSHVKRVKKKEAVGVNKPSNKNEVKKSVTAVPQTPVTESRAPEWLRSDEKIRMQRSLQKIREQITQITRTNLPLEVRHPFVRSTFQAHDLSRTYANTYSGGFFLLDGKVYGVVAAHTLGEVHRKEKQLGRHFLADIYYQDEFFSIPAEAVLFNPVLDVALVTFSWESVQKNGFSEQDLQPLELAEDLPQVGDVLSSHGFVQVHEVANVSGREVLEVFPLSIRTRMTWPRAFRPGLCGSWLVNDLKQAVAVHIGSTEDEHVNEKDDIGYATPAWVLRTMVTAYKNAGEGYFPLELNGYKIADLRADEYISFITLYDKHKKVLWKGKATPRFSSRLLTTLLPKYHPAEMQLTVGRTSWAGPSSTQMREQVSVRKIRYTFPDGFFTALQERK